MLLGQKMWIFECMLFFVTQTLFQIFSRKKMIKTDKMVKNDFEKKFLIAHKIVIGKHHKCNSCSSLKKKHFFPYKNVFK